MYSSGEIISALIYGSKIAFISDALGRSEGSQFVNFDFLHDGYEDQERTWA